MQLYGITIKRTNYFFPLSLLATFNSKGGCMLPESSHSSPVLQGFCILLWNAPRPFFYGTPTPCERKERSAIWYFFCIGFLTLLWKSIGDILWLLYLWPFKTLQNLFFLSFFFLVVVQDRTVITWRFFTLWKITKHFLM